MMNNVEAPPHDASIAVLPESPLDCELFAAWSLQQTVGGTVGTVRTAWRVVGYAQSEGEGVRVYYLDSVPVLL